MQHSVMVYWITWTSAQPMTTLLCSPCVTLRLSHACARALVQFTQWTHLISQTKEQFKCLLIALCCALSRCANALWLFGVFELLKTKWLFCVKITCFTVREIKSMRHTNRTGPHCIWAAFALNVEVQSKWSNAFCCCMFMTHCCISDGFVAPCPNFHFVVDAFISIVFSFNFVEA